LVLGELGPKMLSSTNPKFVMRFPLLEGTTKAAPATLQPTKAAKQSTIRQTLIKKGEWLSTKPAPVKRKRAPTTKTKPTKKIKEKAAKKTAPKTASKVTAKAKPLKDRTKRSSNEVIELSSDDDDTEPDIPLVSLRQVDEPDAEEVLWNDDNESDEEYEFEE
jgi:hypothetical protein